MSERSEYWNGVYQKRAPTEVSWFQAQATTSLSLVASCGVSRDSAVVDVGAGASTFVDGLLALGFADVTLLDIAEAAFESTHRRLPDVHLEYVAADITKWAPPREYGVWHDRAVFHFLTDECARDGYRSALKQGTRAGSHVILGTFALDGPERCSGLPVQRYSATSLAGEFENVLRPVEERIERHRTPAGGEQSFIFVRFVRV